MMKRKLLTVLFTVFILSILTSMTALAATPTPDMPALITSGMNTVVADLRAIIAALVPLVIGLVGTLIAVRAGIRLFRRLTGSATWFNLSISNCSKYE